MSFDPTARRVARAFDRAQLESLLIDIEAGLHDDDPIPRGPVAVALIGVDSDRMEIAWRPVDDGDLVGALVGLHAPDDWLAFGVVCDGRARPVLDVDDGGWLTADPQVEPTAVGLAILVGRSGVVVSGLRSPRDAFVPVADPAPIGRVPDACRRVLGLATPPPSAPVAELWAACWLERVLAAALERPGRLTWDDITALRPEADLEQLGWDDVRCFGARSAEAVLGVRPDVAAWMDEGMFSREVLGALPRLEWLVSELEPVLTDPLRQRLARAIGRPAMT